MFCIVAFIVLSILGIFSASNRELARESLDCVLRRVTLRPCNTGFDEKMKAKILGVVITRSEGAAIFLNRNFELLSWTFFVLLLASSIWTIRGVVLFYTTGSCNGANSSAFCVFDPSGSNNEVSTSSSQVCSMPVPAKFLTARLKNIDLDLFPTLKNGSSQKIVMIACYHCEYSRKAYPMIRDLVKQFKVDLAFLHYPVKESTDYFSRVSYCVNKLEPDKFWTFNDQMFSGDAMELDDPAYLNGLLTSVGLDAGQVNACVADPQTETVVKEQMQEIVKTGFFGTPTVFIQNQVLVGPKPYRVYAIALEGLLYWLK